MEMPRSFPARVSAGFTLTELMITIFIASVLLTIAIPSYQTQIRKSRRTDARTAVLDLAAREERYYSTYNYYTNDALNLGYSTTSQTLFQFPVGVNKYYQISVCVGSGIPSACNGAQALNSTSSTFLIQATPIAGTSQALDTSCLYYTVDNTGKQTAINNITGTGTDDSTICWN